MLLKCPHCGLRYDDREHPDYLVDEHEWPAGSGESCPGSQQNPRGADGDRRPLWAEELLDEQGHPVENAIGLPRKDPDKVIEPGRWRTPVSA